MTVAYTLHTDTRTTVTPVASITSASFTPSANGLLLLAISHERNAHSGALNGTPLTDSLGSTYTQVEYSAGTHTFGSFYALYYTLFSLVSGSSPAARTVTFDPYSTADTAYMTMVIMSATGTITPTIVQSANTSLANTSSTVTCTLPSAPDVTSSTFVAFGTNSDTPFTAQGVPTGFTAIENPVPQNYATMAAFYEDGNTTAAITSGNIGINGGSIGGVIAELTDVSASPFDPIEPRWDYVSPLLRR